MIGVPARQKSWISRHGHILNNPDSEGIMICPESRFRFKEMEKGILRCLDLDEVALLPKHLNKGNESYDTFKKKASGENY
jgi:UDP-2-acetamido-3-amino-2,3-dideoxy-glucuronate N-acetyltransferase